MLILMVFVNILLFHFLLFVECFVLIMESLYSIGVVVELFSHQLTPVCFTHRCVEVWGVERVIHDTDVSRNLRPWANGMSMQRFLLALA